MRFAARLRRKPELIADELSLTMGNGGSATGDSRVMAHFEHASSSRISETRSSLTSLVGRLWDPKKGPGCELGPFILLSAHHRRRDGTRAADHGVWASDALRAPASSSIKR